MLAREPNADLEIRARLLLCDYYSERDKNAAQQEIARSIALLPRAQRQGLRAGLLTCEGDSTRQPATTPRPTSLYEQAVAVATDAHDDEMLAGALFSRGYLLRRAGPVLHRARGPAAGADAVRQEQHAPARGHRAERHRHPLQPHGRQRRRPCTSTRARSRRQREAGLQARSGRHALQPRARAREPARNGSSRAGPTPSPSNCSTSSVTRAAKRLPCAGLAAVANSAGDPRKALDTLKRADALLGQTTDARLAAHIQLVRGVALHRLGRLQDSLHVARRRPWQMFKDADALGDLSVTYAELRACRRSSATGAPPTRCQTEYKNISDKLLDEPARPALRHAEGGIRHRGEGEGKRRCCTRENRREREGAARRAAARASCRRWPSRSP